MASRGKSQTYARKRIIAERGHKCEHCGWTGYIELHHVTRMADGGDHSKSNVLLLCDTCHRKEHGYKERRAGVAKWAEA